MTVRYSPELAEEICERLAAGEGLNTICKDEHMPSEQAVRFWVSEDRDGFASKFARAREFQMDHFVEELVGMSDAIYKNDAPDRAAIARLQLDTRKWVVSRILPKKYGDRLTTDNNTTLDVSDPVKKLLQEISASGNRIYDPKPKPE